MTKLMIVGDTHGNVGPLAHKIQIAQNMGVKHIFQVGDFGLWPGMGGQVYLDEVNRIANNASVDVWAIPGNHEDHPQWEWYFTKPSKVVMHGFVNIRTRVWLSPKVNFFTFDKVRFAVAGGAVSIDKMWRKPGVSWWDNEQLSDDELASIMKYGGPDIDVLLTHDASDHTNWGFHLVPDPDSALHRVKMDKVINHLKPKVHFHGHMHRKYDWVNTVSHGLRNTAFGYDETQWNGASTHTYGLDCDGEIDSWGVFDTADLSFKWGSRIYGADQPNPGPEA